MPAVSTAAAAATAAYTGTHAGKEKSRQTKCCGGKKHAAAAKQSFIQPQEKSPNTATPAAPIKYVLDWLRHGDRKKRARQSWRSARGHTLGTFTINYCRRVTINFPAPPFCSACSCRLCGTQSMCTTDNNRERECFAQRHQLMHHWATTVVLWPHAYALALNLM